MLKSVWVIGVVVIVAACIVGLSRVGHRHPPTPQGPPGGKPTPMPTQPQPGKLSPDQVKVHFESAALREAGVEDRVKAATASLLNEEAELEDLRRKSASVMAETTVTARNAKGEMCRTEALFLLKETFTAVMVRLEFTVDEQGGVHDKRIER